MKFTAESITDLVGQLRAESCKLCSASAEAAELIEELVTENRDLLRRLDGIDGP